MCNNGRKKKSCKSIAESCPKTNETNLAQSKKPFFLHMWEKFFINSSLLKPYFGKDQVRKKAYFRGKKHYLKKIIKYTWVCTLSSIIYCLYTFEQEVEYYSDSQFIHLQKLIIKPINLTYIILQYIVKPHA